MHSPRVRRSIRSRLVSAKDSVNFIVRKPKWDAVLSDELPFGEEANELFEEQLRTAGSYLEYGAGASTIEAARRVQRVVSVESDPEFLAAVGRRCSANALSVSLLHANIGPTGPWGAPILKSSVWHQVDRWNCYPLAPWLQLDEDYRADLVLVDGRFRVACALTVVARQTDVSWTILVDDYVERPEYHVLEEYAELVAVRGRMAAFAPRSSVDPASAEAARQAYMVDWR